MADEEAYKKGVEQKRSFTFRINEAAGRAAIGRAAESLGLRPATGAEMTVLPLPAPDTIRSR